MHVCYIHFPLPSFLFLPLPPSLPPSLPPFLTIPPSPSLTSFLSLLPYFFLCFFSACPPSLSHLSLCLRCWCCWCGREHSHKTSGECEREEINIGWCYWLVIVNVLVRMYTRTSFMYIQCIMLVCVHYYMYIHVYPLSPSVVSMYRYWWHQTSCCKEGKVQHYARYDCHFLPDWHVRVYTHVVLWCTYLQ